MKILAILSFFLLTAHALAQSPDQKSAVDLVNRLVVALNSRDATAIRAFLKTSATDDVPLDTRVERMSGFAMQGAPFRVESAPVVKAGDVGVILVDAEGTRLDLTISVSTGEPLKIKSLRVMPLRTAVSPVGEWSNLQQLAKSLVEKGKLPAMGITVIRDGKAETGVAGVREITGTEAVGPDEPWSIGSIGKPICTTIIGRLIENGKLRWDETLGEALKGIPMNPGYASVTLEQIMHHRGGIPQDLNFNRARVVEIIGDAKTPLTMRGRYAIDILKRTPIAKPGERSAYSNAGYALLGHIAERVAGKPYEELVRELVFSPLGLKNSYSSSENLPVNRPSGHDRGPNGLGAANMTGPLEYLVAPAGGGIYMSTGDLARFGAVHLKGLRGVDGLLKAATVQRLHKGLPERDGDPSFLYACGWGIESNPGIETFHGHNGSNGTMRAQLAIFPKANVVVAAITNSGGESEPSPGLQAALAVGNRYAKEQR